MSARITLTGEFTLEELLNFKTVPQLKEIGQILGYKYKSNARKPLLVEHIRRLMLNSPEKFVQYLFCYEMEAYKDVIEGKMTYDEALKSGVLWYCNRFGLIYGTKEKATNITRLHFEKEVAQKLLSYIDPELKRRHDSGADFVEKVVVGCTNIYGFTDLFYILEYFPEIEKRLNRRFDEETLALVLFPWYNIAFDGQEYQNPILSPFAKAVGFYPDEDHIDFREKPKRFGLDTIIKFGEMPSPNIAIKESAGLRKVFEKYGIRGKYRFEEMAREMWIEKQDESSSPVPTISEYFKFHDINEINEALQAVMNFVNNVPYWRFSGNSSEEVGKKEMQEMLKSGKMPKIEMGPNMRARGIESFQQLQDMAARGEEIPDMPIMPFQSSPKVGRNDPCPCGSGKKYKHCCGK